MGAAREGAQWIGLLGDRPNVREGRDHHAATARAAELLAPYQRDLARPGPLSPLTGRLLLKGRIVAAREP